MFKNVQKVCLKINEEKTKYLVTDTDSNDNKNYRSELQVANLAYGKDDDFKFLGTIMNGDNKQISR